MRMCKHATSVIAGAITMLSLIANPVHAGVSPAWQELSKVGKARTQGVTAFWGGLPELNAKARVKVLDADGPGVITSIHVSAMAADGIEGFGSPQVAGLIIRVFYDGQAKAGIEIDRKSVRVGEECRSRWGP